MSFDSLGLSATILDALKRQGYKKPTPIQEQAIPAVLAGRDVMAAAQTGTGKTAGFTLPILEKLSKGPQAKANQVRALILTPTRELAAQVADSVFTYGKNVSLRSTVVFGGVKINPQMMRLRKGTDILVATPGRLLDLYQQKAVRFDNLEVLVLDEADRMLDMGFIHDIRKVISYMPNERQNLMFSATFSNEIRKLAKTIVHDPVEISVSPRNTTVATVEQWICPVDKKQKSELLSSLIKDNQWPQLLVFSRTKHGADRLTRQLNSRDIPSAAIHGNKSQNQRTRALADFKKSKVQVLVATDIAARGIDIDQLPVVINFDLPNVPEDYVHRIGRTGRAGRTGLAISLVSADEITQLSDIEHLTKKVLERRLIDGFEPDHDVPVTSLERRFKSKKSSTGGGNGNNGGRSNKNSRGRSKPGNKPRNKSRGDSRNKSRNNQGGNTSSGKGNAGSGGNQSPKRKVDRS
ncbi:ATP-dependent RNA helicase RhlE [Nymphon striatum]|nr:ATP-dependent RNA helicase RhlE [Nymphon striatum]